MCNLHANKKCPWLCRAIEVARIAELSFVEVALETIEDILHTGIELQVNVVVKNECVSCLEIKVKEIGGCFHAVAFNVAGIVRYNHGTGICTRE